MPTGGLWFKRAVDLKMKLPESHEISRKTIVSRNKKTQTVLYYSLNRHPESKHRKAAAASKNFATNKNAIP